MMKYVITKYRHDNMLYASVYDSKTYDVDDVLEIHDILISHGNVAPNNIIEFQNIDLSKAKLINVYQVDDIQDFTLTSKYVIKQINCVE